MPASVRYTEPLLAYVARKYFEPFLAILPLMAGTAANLVLFSAVGPPPIWALAYVNFVAVASSVALLVAYRNRFRRRRFRIHENSIALPSVTNIDGSRLESLPLSSVAWVRASRREVRMFWWRREVLFEVEIKIRYGGEDMVLVWPIEAFGTKNLNAIEQTLSPVATGL
jgi:hypothetical protein